MVKRRNRVSDGGGEKKVKWIKRVGRERRVE